MAIILPGLADHLKETAGVLGEGLANLIRPNYKFHQGLQQMFIQKPEMMQQFADMERSAPGTLQRLGFSPELSQTIGSLPESMDAEFNRTNREGIQSTKKKGLDVQSKQLDVQGKKAELDSDIMDRTAKALAKAQGIDEDVMRKHLGLPSKAEAELQSIAAEVAGAQKPVQIQGAKLQLSTINNAIAVDDTLGEIDLYKMAKDFVGGNLKSTELFSHLIGHPTAGKVLQDMIEQVNSNKRLEAEFTLAQIRGSGGMDGVTATSVFNQAGMLYRNSGNAGSIASWSKWITDKDGAMAIVEAALKKPKAEQTIEERDLIETAEADEKQNARKAAADIRAVNQDINRALSNIRRIASSFDNPKDANASIGPELESLQDVLNTKAAMGGKQYFARYGQIHKPFRKDPINLYFEDEAGNEVELAEIMTDTPPVVPKGNGGTTSDTTTASTKSSASISAEALEVASFIMGMPASERVAAVETLKGTPDYEAVKARVLGGSTAPPPTANSRFNLNNQVDSLLSTTPRGNTTTRTQPRMSGSAAAESRGITVRGKQEEDSKKKVDEEVIVAPTSTPVKQNVDVTGMAKSLREMLMPQDALTEPRTGKLSKGSGDTIPSTAKPQKVIDVTKLGGSSVYKKNDRWVIDSTNRSKDGKVPTHRVADIQEMLKPNETIEQLEERILRTEIPDTAKTIVNKVEELVPDMQTKVRELLTAAKAAGHKFKIGETFRPQERQNWLFQSGRSRSGPVVTWTLTSNHADRRAADLVSDAAGYKWLQENAEKFGFKTLGDFDPGHIEYLTDIDDTADNVAIARGR